MDFKALLTKPSIASLILVNVGLTLSAIIFDFSIFEIVLIFWLENLVIGVFNILKMAMAKGKGEKGEEVGCLKILFIPFFIVHFFGFCSGHGIFIFSLFGDRGIVIESISDSLSHYISWSLIGSLVAITISHLISFIFNYIKKKEYEYTSVTKLMFSPYKRIVFVHIFIVAAAFALTAFGKSFMLILLFFILKTVIDLYSHLKEHNLKLR